MDEVSLQSTRARAVLFRLSTVEGWKELGQGLYTITGTGLRFVAIDPNFDMQNDFGFHRPETGRNRSTTSSLGPFHFDTDSSQMDHPADTVNQQKSNDIFGEQYPDSQTKDPFADPEPIPAALDIGTLPEVPYHVFSRPQKWILVWIVGIAGLFSGLSSNIYFPSLDQISKVRSHQARLFKSWLYVNVTSMQDLGVSLQTVSLTITSYLIAQAIAPMFWGAISDALGRRPIYIYSFAVYILANIFLSFSPNFAVLLVFRGIQAVGSASTVSIGIKIYLCMRIQHLTRLKAMVSFKTSPYPRKEVAS